MHWVVYTFGSGLAFFVGVGCVFVALAVSFGHWRGWPRISTIVAILGITLITLSGTPLSIWFYILAILLVAAWLIVMRLGPRVAPGWTNGLRLLVALVWAAGALFELQYQFIPTVTTVGSRQLYLFGDSLSAGLSEHDSNNWPQILARSHDLELINFSRAGATVAVVLHQASGASLGVGIVLLEIGGNDLLGSTSGDDFDSNLEELLQRVCKPGRQVVMFELPIPPLCNEFGRVQRRLAVQYHVLLIPKRLLVDVIAGDGTTLDSIHLSTRGHERMAELVWKIIQPAYDRVSSHHIRSGETPSHQPSWNAPSVSKGIFPSANR